MAVPSLSSTHGIDRDALLRVIEPVVRAHGAELVDVELKPEQGGWVLRVLVEKAGAAASHLSTRDAAVDLELCSDVSRDLSPALDVADLIPHAYNLEVGSPGIERPLRGEADFVRFAGHKAKVRLGGQTVADGAPRVVVGVIEGVEGGKVKLTEGSRIHEVPLDAVDRARLVFELVKGEKKHVGSGRKEPKPKHRKQH